MSLVALAIGSAVLATWASASAGGTIWAYLEKKQHVGCYLGAEGESTGLWICGDGMSKFLPSLAATSALALGLFLLGCVVLVFVRRARLYRHSGLERSRDWVAVVLASVIAVGAAAAVVYVAVALEGPKPLVDLGAGPSATSSSGRSVQQESELKEMVNSLVSS